ncbi:MAG TPA: tyrosine-protein phosphatase [Blastocatellia bacterium]|jgi:protein tyrosine/serine phosphatase|nr:tyrosine-protein phosphatase [Blastocatellia bacterium]
MGRNIRLDNRRPVSLLRRKTATVKTPVLLLSISIALTLSVISYAKPHGKSAENSTSNLVVGDINNFGQVTQFYYRGEQPKGGDYNRLASIGVKTIIDLRDDPKDYAKSLTEQAGMKYVNLPMSDKDYPAAEVTSRFLSIVNDSENWPVYVHCAGGRHRTGAMTAIYRMTMQGWDAERAYEEMKEYDFYTRWGHKAMKKFVFDYFRDMSHRRTENQITATDSLNQ